MTTPATSTRLPNCRHSSTLSSSSLLPLQRSRQPERPRKWPQPLHLGRSGRTAGRRAGTLRLDQRRHELFQQLQVGGVLRVADGRGRGLAGAGTGRSNAGAGDSEQTLGNLLRGEREIEIE